MYRKVKVEEALNKSNITTTTTSTTTIKLNGQLDLKVIT